MMLGLRPVSRRFRIGQLVWWGEFIACVAEIQHGKVTALRGGPVLGDGSFDPARLRPLGLGGIIKVLFDHAQHSQWIWNYRCTDCKGVSACVVPCPKCGCCRFQIRGLAQWWVHLYMSLWLFSGPRNTRLRKVCPGWMRHQVSNFGRWLWCNEWGYRA
jgi:hypothetical protein